MTLKQMFPIENWNSPECFKFAGVNGYAPMLAKELETEESKDKAFNDPNLLVKIYAVLNRYKCREPLRRFIMLLFETAIGSPDIVDAAMKKIESIGKHLFESGEEEKKE